MMAKYFKIVEINEDAFIKHTGAAFEEFDCCQVFKPVGKAVFVAVDEYKEDEISVPLDMFEGGEAE